MNQLTLFNTRLPLTTNGTFTQGLSGWFGSYIRHGVTAPINEFTPAYYAQVFSGEPNDYLDTIPAGISQFLDLPELYSYPSVRKVHNLTMRVVAPDQALLSINASTTFATGAQATLSHHPFVFTDTETVTVAQGTPVTLSASISEYSGSARAAKPVPIKVAGTVTDYVLPVVLTQKTVAPILSDKDVSGVVLELVGVSPMTGTGVLRFIGDEATLIAIKDFPRPDGTVGFRIGDTVQLVDNGYAMRVTDVATSLNTTVGPLSYNLSVAPVAGLAAPTSTAVTYHWNVFPITFATATYALDLYRYDFTLALSYRATEGGEPGVPQIQFRGIDDTTIHGIGAVIPSTTIQPEEQATITIPLPNSVWNRRLTYLSKEFTKPVQGRALLNIPPSGFTGFILGEPVTVLSVSYDAATNRARIRYREMGEIGSPIASLSYAQATSTLTIVGDPSVPLNLVPGQAVYLAGKTLSTPLWLRAAVSERRALLVASYNLNTNTATVILNTPHTDQPSLTGLLNSTLRVSVTQPRQVQLRFDPSGDWQLRLQNSSGMPQEPWLAPLYTRNSRVATFPTVESVDTFVSAVLHVDVDWPGEPPINPTNVVLSDSSVVGLAASSADVCQIADVGLWRGYHIHRMNSTDTADLITTNLGTDVSVDPLLLRTDTLGDIVPKGMVMLYAGGVCPAGFKPVDSFADAEPHTQGFAKQPTIPWPDVVSYDQTSDTTTLRWPFLRFNQTNPDGSLILKNTDVRYLELPLVDINPATGEALTRQVTIKQAKQLIEPGMLLSVDEAEYEEGRSTLVDGDGDMTAIDLYGPNTPNRAGFLVTDLTLTASTDVIDAPSAPPRLLSNSTTSTFGGGYGRISYPSVDPAAFIPRPAGAALDHDVGNALFNIPPAGPFNAEQTNVFPGDRPYAYLVVTSLDDANGLGQAKYRCTRLQFANQPNVPLSVPITGTNLTTDVTPSNDVFGALGTDRPESIKTGDVFFARIYFWLTTSATTAAWVYHDSYLVRLVKVSGTSWDVYRYDGAAHRVYDIGTGGYKQTNAVGTSASFPQQIYSGGIIVLQPAKLYGNPSNRQELRGTLGQFAGPGGALTSSSPQGVGEGYLQQRTALSTAGTAQLAWVSAMVQVGTEMVVTGNMERVGTRSYIRVEPSGYLRYDDPATQIHYGASGHAHTVNNTTDIQLDNPLPRVRSTLLTHYPPRRLPVGHGHGSLGDISYTMPAAYLFTLCEKL